MIPSNKNLESTNESERASCGGCRQGCTDMQGTEAFRQPRRKDQYQFEHSACHTQRTSERDNSIARSRYHHNRAFSLVTGLQYLQPLRALSSGAKQTPRWRPILLSKPQWYTQISRSVNACTVLNQYSGYHLRRALHRPRPQGPPFPPKFPFINPTNPHQTCTNFSTLVSRGYYDTLLFHRIIPSFMLQTGDPTGTGRGGSSIYGEKFEDEISPSLKHTGAGILSMANSGPNTNGSQFFITLAPTPWLDGKHTIFGRVTRGLGVVKRMGLVRTGAEDRPVEEVRILKARVVDDAEEA